MYLALAILSNKLLVYNPKVVIACELMTFKLRKQCKGEKEVFPPLLNTVLTFPRNLGHLPGLLFYQYSNMTFICTRVIFNIEGNFGGCKLWSNGKGSIIGRINFGSFMTKSLLSAYKKFRRCNCPQVQYT